MVIAENGSVVARDGEKLRVTRLQPRVATTVLGRARDLTDSGAADLGVVLCGPDTAFVDRSDDAFLEQVVPYYYAHEVVDDLREVRTELVKVAIYDFGGIEKVTAPTLMALDGAMEVVVSGQHWLDVMAPGVDKSVAVTAVQEKLGITPAQTMVFGDYLNDLAMLDCADWSYAMANAHPRILAQARYVAPSNADNGVVRTVRAALGLPDLL